MQSGGFNLGFSCGQAPYVYHYLQGLLEHLALDPSGSSWLVAGSSRGHLTLFDMRFRLPVVSWQLPPVGPSARSVHIDALAPALAPPQRLGLAAAQPLPRSPLVYVAAGPHEISLWDVETGRCHQVCSVGNAILQYG